MQDNKLEKQKMNVVNFKCNILFHKLKGLSQQTEHA